MAERRIVQKLTIEKKDLLSDETKFHYEDGGRGIVCFISNYSWLDGLSFTAMRERYLEAYDAIRIDCLNGDKYKTGKTTPEGLPDPSIFSTEHNREGIQVGTAIATLIRKEEHAVAASVEFRQVWGAQKRQKLLDTADCDGSNLYEIPQLYWELGLPFIPIKVRSDFFNWALLPDILPTSYPGVQSKRDSLVVDIDRVRLERRIGLYFDAKVTYNDLRTIVPEAFIATKQYDPSKVRAALLKRGLHAERFVRYVYKPFDLRWIYWEDEHGLLSRRSPDLFQATIPGNAFIEARERQPEEGFSRKTFLTSLPDNFGNGFSSFFPRSLVDRTGSIAQWNLPKPVLDFVTKWRSARGDFQSRGLNPTCSGLPR
jgi:hypothetical protein